MPRLSWHPGLFARTFLLLALLLIASAAAWWQTFRAIEHEPRAQQIAQQLVSIVNITRVALIHSIPRDRRELLLDLATNEGVQIYPREKRDRITPIPPDPLLQRVAAVAKSRLYGNTTIAWAVNQMPGIWVSFEIDHDQYWLVIERERVARISNAQWLGWGAASLLLSFLGSLMLVGLVNQPLSRLAKAADALSRGERPSVLPETGAQEIKQLNHSFNRMVGELARLESDRNLMLAGISHDLRTPLSRMRLELEMCQLDDGVRQAIYEDIHQIDRTVGQFLDYARPNQYIPCPALDISALTESIAQREASRGTSAMLQLSTNISPGLNVRIREVDLDRALMNLFENVRRYAVEADGRARVALSVERLRDQVIIRLSDHGPGITEHDRLRLLQPFTRGSSARSDSSGAGLGLAIVKRIVERNQGHITLGHAASGGLEVCLAFALVDPPSA